MGKIALLVSREEMLHQAHNILQEKKYAIDEMRVIRTEDSVLEARNSIANGASIIITRGLQAFLIKQYTDIPVVEIVITAQEMALLVVRAKQIVGKANPVIAVVGFDNMFCDMSYFDEIYGIELKTYYAKSGNELERAIEAAVADEVDLVIGGDTAISRSSEAGIASLFLSTTEDSIKNAFSMAEKMNYAMSVEKKNAAQMETMMDYSFSGVIKTDQNGTITVANRIMEDILECSADFLVGKHITKIFKDIDRDKLTQVLEDGSETYSLFMQFNRTGIYGILAPILVDGGVDGAILSCHKMKKKSTVTQEVLKQRYQQGLIARGSFDDILQMSKSMQDTVHMAKLYAQSERPILITGETGTERRLLAQSIHNHSMRNEEPFVMVSCNGLSEENQKNLIFGEQGAIVTVDKGTLLIEEIDKLSLANQYSLFQLIRYKIRRQTIHLDIRVIATTKVSLAPLVRRGEFLGDLYYILQGLTIVIPPLRERKEDLKYKIEMGIRETCEHYSRYHVLTQGGMKAMLEYPWKGNLLQIESFCERLILTAGKRSLDEIAVNGLLNLLYPKPLEEGLNSEDEGDSEYCENDGCRTGKKEDEKAASVRAVLKKYNGSRQKAAEELGVSKATLWRWMKKWEL